MFQICPVCDMQQDIEPYDVCQVCGHEWTSEEIRSSTPVPIERPLTPRAPDSLKAGVLSLPNIVKVESVLPAVSG